MSKIENHLIAIALVIVAAATFALLATLAYGSYPGPDERYEEENSAYFGSDAKAISRTYGAYYGDTDGYHWIHHLSGQAVESGYGYGQLGVRWTGSSYAANSGNWWYEYTDEMQYGRDITTGVWLGDPPVYYPGVEPATYMITQTHASFIKYSDYSTDEVWQTLIMTIG